jgi:hypothetical protein
MRGKPEANLSERQWQDVWFQGASLLGEGDRDSKLSSEQQWVILPGGSAGATKSRRG